MERTTRPLVAFDVTPLQNAHRLRGIGRYVGGLARRLLAQTEIPIEFWGWDHDRPFEAEAPHHAIWLPGYRIPNARAPWIFAKLGMLLRARRSQARVIHFTDPRALLLLRGCQIMTTVYDLIPMLEPSRGGLIERWGYRHYLRQLQGVARIFAISKQTAADVTERLAIPGSMIVVAAPGVDLSVSPTRQPRTWPYFLYVGSPEPHKNVFLLLRAMALAADLPERLIIAGRWYAEHIAGMLSETETLPALRGRIQFYGYVPDAELADLISSATALVVPSTREGFGLPVAEGFAAGGAVIHSRIPVLMEVSGGAALTFDPGSADELAACLRRVSEQPDERTRLRALGQKRLASISWDAALDATLGVYRDGLGLQPIPVGDGRATP